MNPGLLPDLTVVATALLVLVAEIVLPRPLRWRGVFVTALLGLLATAGLLVAYGASDTALAGHHLRPWATPLRLAATIAALFSLAMLPSHQDRSNRRQRRVVAPGVAAFLILASLCGTFTLAGTHDLIGFLVSLELATIPLFALAALCRDRQAGEAGLKFLLSGALATALLVFGLSYLYGATGSVDFTVLATHLDGTLARSGALLVVLALLFKLAAVPMHWWAPEVNDGTLTPVAAYLGSGSKFTGLIGLLVLLEGPFAGLLDALRPFLFTAAIASMVVGNLGALAQDRLRRFMAWSSIAQVGFFLLAVACGPQATTAVAFYAVVYVCSNGLVFQVLDCLGESRRGDAAALHGLSRQSPALALLLTMAAFSLAGIPPLAGFLGKFALLLAPAQRGLYVLVLIGALNGLVGLYYYLRLVREAYLVEPITTPDTLRLDAPQRLALACAAMAVLGLGIWSGAHGWIAGLAG